MSEFVDVLAPEFWIDGVATREIACPGVIRLGLFARERDDNIVKVKLLMPVTVVFVEQPRTLEFLRKRHAALSFTN